MSLIHTLPEAIGGTPLLCLEHAAAAWGLSARIYAKLEYMNPLGSSKDRAALYMLRAAEAAGTLAPGGTIIEPTSGNTGIGLAYICATRGYRVILTMPENMSLERRQLLAALGAELVLTPATDGMDGAAKRAQELQAATPGSIIPDQFSNPANAQAHRETTGPEILKDLDGPVDFLVATFGTGGTITGCGEVLKAYNPATRVIAVEPAGSPLLSQGRTGPHKLQGIGANFIPTLLNQALLDEVRTVEDAAAYAMCRELGRLEGLLVGISSGAALCVGKALALEPENAHKNIVVICPDGGERYLSAGLFE